MDAVQMVRGATGLVYDDRLRSEPELPDSPEQLQLIARCQNISARPATAEELLLKHTREHYGLIASASHDSLLAVGSTIELLDNILEGCIGNGMVVIRPPSKRETKDGIGSFNNVAVAAQKALNSRQAQRILIVDWDVHHHGQDIQRAFYKDGRVLYFSVHRHQRESDSDSIGEDKGQGYNFNVPLNGTEGKQNADYLALWQQLLMPVAIEFQPDLVIVAAGLGASAGAMDITPDCYAHLLSPLLTLASGRLAVILKEGESCQPNVAEGIHFMLRTLLGDVCPPLVESPSSVSALMRTAIHKCTVTHRPYWRSLQVQCSYDLEGLDQETNRLEVGQSACIANGNGYKENTDEFKNIKAKHRSHLESPGNGVGLVFDEVMLKHRDLFDDHPECPERLIAIRQRLLDCGLLPSRLLPIVARSSTTEDLCTVHSSAYVERIRGSSKQTAAACMKASADDIFPTIYRHPDQFNSASLATGGVLAATEAVLRHHVRSAICAIRPPGHHAEEADAEGFSTFNHIAVAAEVALRDYPSTVRRVLIVDWDVHHGHGTQRLFESNPNVLYISVHRYDLAAYVPKRRDADADYVGSGAGRGFNVNIPWNRAGMGDAEYVAVFQRLILPIAYEFGPDLVLVSAGFDAAVGDPLGQCRVSAEAFGHFTAWLMALAGGRLVLALEGGYNVDSTSWAMTMCAKALLGDPLPALQVPGVRTGMNWGIAASAARTLQRVWAVQAEWWQSVRGWNVRLPEDDTTAIIDKKWFCLECHLNECNCYQQTQLLNHSSVHPDVSMTLTIDNSSVWCYVCKAYIDTTQSYGYRNQTCFG